MSALHLATRLHALRDDGERALEAADFVLELADALFFVDQRVVKIRERLVVVRALDLNLDDAVIV
jgi:hypothetical protein